MPAAHSPAPGTPAPDFAAPVVGGSFETGTTLTLSSLKGKPTILYFYPKDDTPGCTKQACALRDGWADIQKKAHVFGVSVDSVKSHEKFIRKYTLPFPLLSDEDHQIAESYGVWVEKNLYGRKYMGTERTTFVIDATGSIQAVLPKVKPEAHLETLLNLF